MAADWPQPDWQTEDGSVRLYCADCLDLLPQLPDGSVDAVVTSPPYNTLPTSHKPSGIHGERKTGINKWIHKAANGYADSRSEGEYQSWLHSIVSECLRVACGLVWVNHKVRYRNGWAVHPARFLDFPIYSEVIWDRGGSMALNCNRYAPSHEVLLAFGDKHWWDDSLNTKMSVWRIPPQRSDDHPCPFPIEIAERPIKSSCPPGGVTLDPFMGAGTTGMACAGNGRSFIGIEKEPKYFDIAVQRIQQAREEAGLFLQGAEA